MLKVKEEILKIENGIYYFEDNIYTGIIYFTQDDNVLDIKICINGKVTKSYENKYINYKTYELHLHAQEVEDILDDEEYIEDDSFRYFYKEEPFNGVFYGFKEGLLIEENICINGFFVDNDRQGFVAGYAKIKYFKNGEMSYLHLNNGYCEQWYDFDYMKEVRNFYIRIYKDYKGKETIESLVEVFFDENNNVYHINIRGNYLEDIKRIKNQIEFNIYVANTFFIDKNTSEILYVNGINDDIIYYLNKNEGFSKMTKLFIFHKSLISNKSFNIIKKCKNLRGLDLLLSNVDTNILNEIKKENPLCKIELNYKEIIL